MLGNSVAVEFLVSKDRLLTLVDSERQQSRISREGPRRDVVLIVLLGPDYPLRSVL